MVNLGNKYGMFDRQSQCNIQQRSATVNHDIDTKVWNPNSGEVELNII